MTIFNNISADFVLMSADYIIENGHSFEWNEDPVTVFLKWTDFGILQRISPTSLSNSFKETPPENLPEFDDKFKILSSIIGGNKEICLPLFQCYFN